MTIEDKITALLEICSKLNLSIRFESLGGTGGGLCRIKGKPVIFIDTDTDSDVRYEKLLSAVAGFSEIETMFILPEVRADLELIKGSGH
jgi:hypothetical protein